MGSPLLFVDMSLALLEAAIDDRPRLGRELDAVIAEGWEGFPEALPVLRDSARTRPHPSRFGSFFFVHEEPRTLIGMGGFKSEPREGEVEIGYAVAPAFQGRGVATQAVKMMLERAFADPLVRTVLANTLAGPNPSTRVLEKSGFVHAGEIVDPDDGTVWNWRYPRRSGR